MSNENKVKLVNGYKIAEKANLRGADLREADLFKADLRGADISFMEGKMIFSFVFEMHFAYCCDGNIKIGCLTQTVQEWLETYKEIGKENKYSEEQIKKYGAFIKMCIKMQKV